MGCGATTLGPTKSPPRHSGPIFGTKTTVPEAVHCPYSRTFDNTSLCGLKKCVCGSSSQDLRNSDLTKNMDDGVSHYCRQDAFFSKENITQRRDNQIIVIHRSRSRGLSTPPRPASTNKTQSHDRIIPKSAPIKTFQGKTCVAPGPRLHVLLFANIAKIVLDRVAVETFSSNFVAQTTEENVWW